MGLDQFATNTILMEKCSQICKENNVPFLLRYELGDWIEHQAWNDLAQKGDQDCERFGAQILEEMIAQIDKVSSEKDAFSKFQLQDAKRVLEKDFRTNPGELIKAMGKILSHERTLTEAPSDKRDQGCSEEDRALKIYRDKSQDISCHLAQLEKDIDNVQRQVSTFHDCITAQVSRINRNNDRLLEIQNSSSVTQAVQDEARRIESDNSSVAVSVVNQKKKIYQLALHVAQRHVGLLDRTQSVIGHYKRQQKDSVCFMGKTPEGALDTMNKLCEAVGNQLMAVVHLLDKMMDSVKLLDVQGDDTKGCFELLAKEMEKRLEDHLQKSFIITKQPPSVMKIVKNKSPAMFLSVRMLGGVAYGLNLKPPKVTVRVYSEKDIPTALEKVQPMQGVCNKVENGNNVMMEYKKATGHLQANLNNVEFREVERLEKRGRDDRVTEYKYGVIFYTTLHIGPKSYPIKVLSLPLILTSQTSQEGAAKGTLMWHAAFSQDGAPPYEDPDEVPWGSLEKIIVGMFTETGRNLNKEQLNYIAKNIFGGSEVTETDFSSHPITKDRFMRDKVHGGRDFTYWKWLYAAKNLIMEHVRTEWKDNLIYGFIGKAEADKLLIDKPPGTFLLRFRERRVEGNQKANTCAYLALAVVVEDDRGIKTVEHVKDNLTPQKIHEHTLVQILRNMVHGETARPILSTVYPDVPFDDVVQKYLPDKGEHSDTGYKDTDWQIVVRFNHRQNSQMCYPASPDSVDSIMSSPRSVQSTSSVDTAPPAIAPWGNGSTFNFSDMSLLLLTNPCDVNIGQLPEDLTHVEPSLKPNSTNPMLSEIPVSVMEFNSDSTSDM